MDKIINLTNDQINRNSRLRYAKGQLWVETSKPFFLARFFRWIRGDYSSTRILNAADAVARLMLSNKANYSAVQWNQMDINFANIRYLCNMPKHGTRYVNRGKDIHAAALAALNPQRPQAIPQRPQPQQVKPNLDSQGWEKYDPKRLEDVLPSEPPKPVVPQAVAQPIASQSVIDPALKDRWAKALDEDDWEAAPLNSLMDLEINEKLATPETLLAWLWKSIRTEEDPKQASIIEAKIGGNTAKVVTDLLKLIGIETPNACMGKALEPEQDSFEEYFKSKGDFIKSKLIAEGYLSPANS